MKCNRGDVIIVDHRFSDAAGSKVRPALIVQGDVRNALLAETIVVLITSNLRFVATDATQLLIEFSTPDGKASGLTKDSTVKCGKLFTVHENLIRQRIGGLSPALRSRINDGLKSALELP